MWDYVLSEEKQKYIPKIGAVILPNGIVRIYRVKDDKEEAKFKDGIVCADLEEVFEVIGEMQAKAKKVRKDEKI